MICDFGIKGENAAMKPITFILLLLGATLAKGADPFVMKDGDYTLKTTQVTVDDPHVQFPHSPIPDADYKLNKEAEQLLLKISREGKAVSLLGATGTLEKATENERIYELQGKKLTAGAQLILKKTAEGVIGTYTLFGSGRPVLVSYRGAVTPAVAASDGAKAGTSAKK